MSQQIIKTSILSASLLIVLSSLFLDPAAASDKQRVSVGNFGLPGIVDLPTAQRFPDGELVVTQQLHSSLARTGLAFQALPRVGVAFRYSGHGVNGGMAYGRINHDRSFDAHISIIDEGKFLPAISIGLRDFIGTGWYSSEYFVGTKTVGDLELTVGIGFGRLNGKNAFSNPLKALSSRFEKRDTNDFGKGGTLGTVNWFHGDASTFYGLRYQIGDKISIAAEYTQDIMSRENSYLNVESPWNWSVEYRLNDYLSLSAQYLHGTQASVTGHVTINPNRPPVLGGKELAPVPMRLRSGSSFVVNRSDEQIIRKVLRADLFEIHELNISKENVIVVVTNTKFRSTSQAVGRIASTLQRFTSNTVKVAYISFRSGDLQTASYRVNLNKITEEQFAPQTSTIGQASIVAIDSRVQSTSENKRHFIWGIGPYVEHRLFNPDMPLSAETGIEIAVGYKIAPGLKLSTAIRKSVLTNLTDNKRLDSGSLLPKVHSSWPLYDQEGQSGHIHSLTLSNVKNLAPGLYGRIHAGLLEPFFAGFGGEILYKPAQWPIGIGIDIHRVRQRDYDMRFNLLDYETTIGHVSFYYDAGGMFDIEVNAGRYLAGDRGITTTISRKFGSGWEIGGYATITDVPFDTFGEGSFDKAIYVSLPIDWIISSPNRTKRRLTIRPITRDGGANLVSARQLNRQIEESQNASFKREIGRLWK